MENTNRELKDAQKEMKRVEEANTNEIKKLKQENVKRKREIDDIWEKLELLEVKAEEEMPRLQSVIGSVRLNKGEKRKRGRGKECNQDDETSSDSSGEHATGNEPRELEVEGYDEGEAEITNENGYSWSSEEKEKGVMIIAKRKWDEKYTLSEWLELALEEERGWTLINCRTISTRIILFERKEVRDRLFNMKEILKRGERYY